MNAIRYDIRRQLQGTPSDSGQYEVTARIVSQTQEDGSPLDTPLILSTCDGPECGSGMTSQERAAAAVRAVDAAQALDLANANSAASPTGSTTGGRGSGGIFPGVGLPGSLPKLSPASWLMIAALTVAGLYVVERKR